MKAIQVHQFGGPEVLQLQEIPTPKPAAGQVLVRVHAAGVNPFDWKVREGYMKSMLPLTLPFIPGWDVSGTVEATGPGVTRFKKGDAVYGNPSVARNGAYAEFISVKESEITAKPASIDHVQAASVPVAASTAWQALFDVAGLQPGQKVLIHAAVVLQGIDGRELRADSEIQRRVSQRKIKVDQDGAL